MSYYKLTGKGARDVGWYDALDQAFRFELVLSFVESGDRVVDLGCGLGALSDYLPNDIEYVGLERESEFVHAAHAAGRRGVRLVDFSVEEIPQGDVVVALGVGVSDGAQTEFVSLVDRMRSASTRDFVLCCANNNAPVALKLESGFTPFELGHPWTRFENVHSNRRFPSASQCVERAAGRLGVESPESLAHAWFSCGEDERVVSLFPMLSASWVELYRSKLLVVA